MRKNERDRISKAVRDALVLLATATRGAAFDGPEGVALLEHYRGLVQTAHALARKGERSLRDLEELKAEIWMAIGQWHDYRELRPAGNPEFDAMLKFYREA